MGTRKSSALVLPALLLCILLAACGSGAVSVEPRSQPAPETAAVPTSSLAPGPPDTLRWSIEGIDQLEVLDPAAPANNAAVAVIGLVFGGLTRLDEHLEVRLDGASDWEVSSDGKTYTFTIRNNLRFADGTAVTADDFVYSINRALAPETAAFGIAGRLRHVVGALDVLAGRASRASGVRALDQRTLQIELDRPQAYFRSQLSFPYTFVVPRALVESGPDWYRRAYGTGPFRVKEWRRGQALVLEANRHYWRGEPGFDEIVISFHPQSEVAVERYLAGELDITGSQQNPVPAAYVPKLRDTPHFRSSASLTTRYVGFNNALPPFDQVEVRRAFAMAVDKAALTREVLNGTAAPADRILPNNMLGTELPIRPLPYDPQAARAELAAAGFPGGSGFPQVQLAYAREGDNASVAAALQRFWREHLGVESELAPYDLQEFNERLDRTYYQPSEGLQLYLSVWGADYPDPQNFISQQLRSEVPHNNGHFSDAELDRLVDEADRLAKGDEVDRRLQLYNQAEQIAIDKVGWLPLYYPTFNVLLRPDLEGLSITPLGIAVPDWTLVRRR